MEFYFAIAGVFFLNAFLSADSVLNKERMIRGLFRLNYAYLCIALVVIGGCRWLTGSDWPPYYNYFISFNTWHEFNNGTFEILYALLNFIVKCFSSSYTAFLLVLHGLTVLLKSKIIARYAFLPGLVLFLFYCQSVGDIFAVRQTLSIAVLFFSLKAIKEKKKFAFVLITTLATMIHNASVIWFLAYAIFWKRLRTSRIYIAFFICFAVGLFSQKIYGTVIPVILSPFSTKIRMVGKLLVYATGAASSAFSVHTVLSLAKRIIFVPLFLLIRKKERNNEFYCGVLNLWIFGTLVYLLFSNSLNVFQRMTTPFISLEIFLLPYIFKNEKKYAKPIYFLLICLYALSKLVSALNAYPDLYMPYYSIFHYENRVMH